MAFSILLQAWVFTSYFSVASSIFHLCAIAIDRYRAITDPFGYGSKRTLRHLLTIITFVWILSFIVVSPPYFGWGISWPESFDESTPCTIPQVILDLDFNLFLEKGKKRL